MTDALVRAEFPVGRPDGLSVRLPRLGARPAPRPRSLPGEGLASGVDDVQRQDVPEGADVRVAHQGERTLRESINITMFICGTWIDLCVRLGAWTWA